MANKNLPHPVLSSVWHSFFKQLNIINNRANVLDIAAGAGAVFDAIDFPHSLILHACDASGEALNLLKQKMPDIHVYQTDISKTGLAYDSFDAVVSQFGIEYGGELAFMEAWRLLRKGGVLQFVCHSKTSQVARSHQSALNLMQKLIAFDFLNIFDALVDNYGNLSPRALQALQVIYIQCKDSEAYQHPYAVHLLQTLQQLVEDPYAYDPQDLKLWCSAFTSEFAKNQLLFTDILAAGMTKQELSSLMTCISGSKDFEIQPLQGSSDMDTLAWLVSCTKE